MSFGNFRIKIDTSDEPAVLRRLICADWPEPKDVFLKRELADFLQTESTYYTGFTLNGVPVSTFGDVFAMLEDGQTEVTLEARREPV